MPELPDVELYVQHIHRRVVGSPLLRVRVASPFLVRSFDPPMRAAENVDVLSVRRMGKRIVFGLSADLHLVLHLMVAGRLRWRELGAKVPGKVGLAAFDFPAGTLILTEASSKKRASLHLLRGEDAVRALDPRGIEPLCASLAEFTSAVRRESHTLKRTLTDPRIFSGIGNAYSDEILFHARLSPIRLTKAIGDDEIHRLYEATQATLTDWTSRLASEAGEGFPERVTAFREDMAVHGRYKQPCPRCGSPVQRIAYAENESNYCATCQTGGKLLADRSLSRLLKGDWPKTLEELEERKKAIIARTER